jgi:sugar-specific transcriptional regulator TrmB
MTTTTRQKPLNQLVNLGLSEHQALVYQTLIENGPLPAKSIAGKIGILPHAVYRLIKKLEKLELVSTNKDHPKIFRPVPPSVALEVLSKNKITDIEDLKTQALNALITKTKPSETQVEILTNKSQLFKTYVSKAQKAKTEILIISIGEHISGQMMITNRDAIERGVDFRMIAHKYDRTNQKLLSSWVKMGWQVRHYPDWGFHLIVIDKKTSILSINNPRNTEERISFLFQSTGLSKAFRDYFFSIWEKATPIK